MKKVHQIYGPSASKTACGRNTCDVLKTCMPGIKVTCLICKKVEATRRREAKMRGGK